jgi:hypothetical protein
MTSTVENGRLTAKFRMALGGSVDAKSWLAGADGSQKRRPVTGENGKNRWKMLEKHKKSWKTIGRSLDFQHSVFFLFFWCMFFYFKKKVSVEEKEETSR